MTKFDSNATVTGLSTDAIHRIHWPITEWQKRRSCIARVYIPADGEISDSVLFRRANQALSSNAVRASAGMLQDGRAVTHAVVEDAT